MCAVDVATMGMPSSFRDETPMESNGVQSFSPIEEPGVHVLLADPLLEDKVNALEQRMAPVLKALTDMTKP